MNPFSTRPLAIALFAALAAAAGAQAAQKTTSRCNITGPGVNILVHTVGQPAVQMSDVSIQVNNTTAANKIAIVQLTADAGVDAGTELRVGFNLDGAAIGYVGPQNFANHTEFWQTRNTVAQISIPPGKHKIQPLFFAQGAISGSTAIIDDRCMIVTF